MELKGLKNRFEIEGDQLDSSENSGAKKFESLILYGQLDRLLKNEYFLSLDRYGQVDAITRCIKRRIAQLDNMSGRLMRHQQTFASGVKANLASQYLEKLISRILDKFISEEIDIVEMIADDAKGKQRF